MTSLKIIGYYNHFNLGDDQYKSAFNKILSSHFNNSLNIEYIDCDKINTYNFQKDDIILVGGGDVLNDYFIDKLISVFHNKLNKIIAISVGLPFISFLTNTTKLYIFDYIFIRTKQDLNLFTTYFHPNRIFYIPDISYVNIDTCKIESSILNDIIKIRNTNKKIVTLSLSRHVCKSTIYEDIVLSFVHFIKYLVTFNYHVILLPFNTNNEKNTHNDIIIHTDIYNKLLYNSNIITHVTNIKKTVSIEELISIYDYVDYNVCMRFHSFLISVYKGVPCLPIFTTRKIENLLLDINYCIYYNLPTDQHYQPIECNPKVIINSFTQLLNMSDNIKKTLSLYNQNNYSDIKSSLDIFYNLLDNSYDKIFIQGLVNETDSRLHKLYNILQHYVNTTHNISDFRSVKSINIQNIIVGLTSYYLTGSIDSKYNWGLTQKMFTLDPPFDWYSEWKWILSNIHESHYTKLVDNPIGLFNINYIDQNDYSGVHRSGWQYVYNNIIKYHNSNSSTLLDLYIDKTFHWNLDVNKLLGIVPYKKNWMGFIHHTFDTSFSDYNCIKLLELPEFIESLKYCKGLFVLSNYLKLQLESRIELQSIPIINLVHPTFTNVPLFKLDNLIANPDKKIIYIGGWLRNTFTFYNINFPKNLTIKYGYLLGDNTSKFYNTLTNITFKSVILRGKHSNNYYPSSDFLSDLHDILIKNKNIPFTNIPNISFDIKPSDNITNNWNKFFYQHVSCILSNVDYIDHVNNIEYDKLLSENIVFIHLVDASAVNTVIECIVRNTPIIINKHPAIVELLGTKYPLYFTSSDYISINNEIHKLLLDTNNIKSATKYLSKLDKSIYDIDYFITTFTSYF